MLKIDLSKSDIKKLEDGYWNWIKTYQLSSLLSQIASDIELQNLYFGSQSKYSIWASRNLAVGYNLKNINDNELAGIRSLILAKPDELYDFQLNQSKNIKSSLKKESINYFISTYCKVRKSSQLKKLFLETNILKTCPYCNRNYITHIKRGKNKIYLTLELDHFYSKDEHPLLAISLYNLIPCCHTCNHLKSVSTKEIYNPYSLGFGDEGVFKYDESSLVEVLLGCYKHNSIRHLVKLISENQNIINAESIFGLNDIYHSHSDEAINLIYKKKIFTDQRINELICDYLKPLGYDENRLKTMLYSIYFQNENHGNKILSKFLSDLYNDLELRGI